MMVFIFIVILQYQNAIKKIQSLWDSLKQNILLMNKTRWQYY
jgi:hypothetical protein